MGIHVPVIPRRHSREDRDRGSFTCHATAMSSSFAIHRNMGETTPGLNHVPTPGYWICEMAARSLVEPKRGYLVVAELFMKVVFL
jgi:hypothetical protein